MQEQTVELGIAAVGREHWEDGEAEIETSRKDRVLPNYDAPADDDPDEGDEDAEDEAD